ncbi:zinc-binding dehydrogenase [Arthrobacter zhangbolii]|uniref:Zinc-binding dehydrogenase n=1 Tax=Arthrobacter zhangbolii TaxID=2886936 RepID=A0A9X1M938_9MICC|nr:MULTISPECIES: zinc-binding dehydrogenase [Arthrobacter]MCC3273669.1 zinc-binding dehydrogenase [Arthrobacter zhangbolii]MCC3295734.1 zinc-binding dehydrogenase [Arthrobacter zhangbolii]MDN3905950.1 zinc-binding dehydrogenase [Arthrobacter sp. YD2]UON92474.1 zinc-binding dehydrogenase [Arthrobacter zhangbolii]
MKAWQYMGNRQPIQLNEVPEPVLSPTQVLIDVKAAGLCHSDVMYMEVGDSAMPFLPMTQGHENAGVITALGSEVTGFKVGDVVGVCSSGVQPPLGMFTPGGFADKLAADYRDLARVPDGLDLSLAALATDAGMTSYHAMIKVGGAGKGMKVGVIGFGGLGQIGARAAVLAGAEVHVAEMKEEAWEAAREVGAVSCVRDAAEWVTDPRRGGDFDLIVDYAGFDTTQKAVNAVRRGGKVVQVGLGKPTFTVATNTILGKSIEGSLGGTVADIEEVFDLMLRGEITPAYEEIGFDQVGEGLERLKNNQVLGRLVARFGD